MLCVEGSDGNWGHEARTSKEVNIRDQQAALHRLAARPQACKDVSCCIQSRIRRSDEHKSTDASSSRSIITVPVSVCLSLCLIKANLADWLSHLGLSQYYQVLVQNGYENIDFVSDISLEDLREIGITKLGKIKRHY